MENNTLKFENFTEGVYVIDITYGITYLLRN